ncbi:helix-turn-helix domain-containing protein [Halarchaeum acidiphilum]|uniref:hypothetical protein n=1 Tax=Halarchaeum acidiphilum TaxID=489138 RepID=UPI000371DF58|nr:hypothetical protein [Halarchaeum acidiphilum]
MTPFGAFHAYKVAMCLASAIGLAYLLIAELDHPDYRWPILVTTFGVFAFAIGEPVSEYLIGSPVAHALHAVILSIIVVGLAGFVDASRHSTDWAALVASDPVDVRRHEPWMTALDDRILSLFHSSELVLTPAIIALNLDYSRSEVNRRLSKLADAGYVERVDRGKYQLTGQGSAYLRESSETAGGGPENAV